MPSYPLAKTTYRKLLQDIAAIYDASMKEIRTTVEEILKKAYWEIGRRIVEVEQKGNLHAAYGSHLLEDLSRDLMQMNRKGFSVTNLRNMRQVYTAFSIHQLTDELTWTHYVILSSILDKKDRDTYVRKTIQQKWDVEELRDVLQQKNVARNFIDAKESRSLAVVKRDGKDIKIPRLDVKRGLLNVYRLVEPLDSSSQKDALWLDCGFFTYHRVERPDGILAKPGDIVTAFFTSKGFSLKRLDSQEAPLKSFLYTYAAKITKVTDGDTLTVMADMGFGLRSKQKLRLRRINAPELASPHGKKAKDFVVKQLKSCSSVVVKTYSTDIFDRYLVDVFYLPDCNDVEKIARQGILLNQELLDAGLAAVWQVQSPDDLTSLN